MPSITTKQSKQTPIPQKIPRLFLLNLVFLRERWLAASKAAPTDCPLTAVIVVSSKVIGEDANVLGLWHAAGHEGAGIGLAPATGELITAQIKGDKPFMASCMP